MMAQVALPKRKLPRYKGTIVCQCCGAEYKPNLSWAVGYSVGTESGAKLLYPLGKKKCPICRTDEEDIIPEEKTHEINRCNQ